jgi:hypothetical protein
MTLASLYLTYVTCTAACYPAVVDQLLRLPAGEAKTKVSEDIKTFLDTVLTQIDGLPSSDLESVSIAAENALSDLYGQPEKQAEGDEYSWKAIEIEDRRREEFYALVVNALDGKRGGSFE